MKKKGLLLILPLLVLLMSIFMVTPVSADAPVLENWQIGDMAGGAAYCYLTINTTNLQVESFTIINNTDQPVRLRVYYDGWGDDYVIFEMFALPYTNNWEPISNFKFHRLPLTDPDDPGSIRFPNKTYIAVRYG